MGVTISNLLQNTEGGGWTCELKLWQRWGFVCCLLSQVLEMSTVKCLETTRYYIGSMKRLHRHHVCNPGWRWPWIADPPTSTSQKLTIQGTIPTLYMHRLNPGSPSAGKHPNHWVTTPDPTYLEFFFFFGYSVLPLAVGCAIHLPARRLLLKMLTVKSRQYGVSLPHA